MAEIRSLLPVFIIQFWPGLLTVFWLFFKDIESGRVRAFANMLMNSDYELIRDNFVLKTL